MYDNLKQCLAGGGAFGAYIRVGFVGGSFLTKPAAVAQKDYTDALTVTRYITLTADEIDGRRIARVGLTDCEGGAELLGADAESAAGEGELERTVTFTLALARPAGRLRSEKLFDMLTGGIPFRGAFTLMSDRGETVAATPVFTDGGVTFAADFARGFGAVTLCAGGEEALTLTPGRQVVTETIVRGADGEFAARAAGARALVAISSGVQAVEAIGIAVPTALGAEIKLPLKFGGALSAFGDWLVLTEAGRVRVYGAGFKPTASRSGENIADCAVASDGTFAVADSRRIRVCRGGADLCELPVVSSSLALTGSGDALRLHYLSGGKLTGFDVAAAKEIYSTVSDCAAIVDRGARVFGVAPGYTRLYGADGALLRSAAIAEGSLVKVTGKCCGLFLLQTTTRSWLAGPYAQTGLAGEGKSLCGRAALVTSGGKTSLVRLGEDVDITVCELAADDAAFADRLYYRRGETLFCREATGSALRIVADDAEVAIAAQIAADAGAGNGATARVSIALI